MATQPAERALALQLNKKCGDYNDVDDDDNDDADDDDDDVASAIATCAVFAPSMHWKGGTKTGPETGLSVTLLPVYPSGIS